MSAPGGNSHTVWTKAWHAVRFVLFGLGGFLIMLWFWADLMGRTLTEAKYHHEFVSPYLSVPLVFIGALLMLFGVGELGRWRFVFVFLSIPASLSFVFLIPESVWSIRSTGHRWADGWTGRRVFRHHGVHSEVADGKTWNFRNPSRAAQADCLQIRLPGTATIH